MMEIHCTNTNATVSLVKICGFSSLLQKLHQFSSNEQMFIINIRILLFNFLLVCEIVDGMRGQ